MNPSLNLLLLLVFVFMASAFPIIQQQQIPFELTTATKKQTIDKPTVESVPSASYIEDYDQINKLNDYYHTIVSEVVDFTLSEVLETAPETFLTIHELQIIGKEFCQTSAHDFLLTLQKELHHQVKISLLASVRPLITSLYNDNENISVMELNTMMSEELATILDPQKVSVDIINQVYEEQQQEKINYFINYFRLYFDKQWAQTVHHKKNEFFALEAWLRSWLMDIEFMLKDEFDLKMPLLL